MGRDVVRVVLGKVVQRHRRGRAWRTVALALGLALLGTACSGDGDGSSARASGADGDGSGSELLIGGIPDQELSVLEERFGGLADYLEERLGIAVEYRPVVDYASLVTAFRNGDVPLAFFGGLTGVQARLAVPGAHAVAQRDIDPEFRSVFVAREGVEADGLSDLAGLSFTFGSESSTSGHLMPRHFLREAGVDPEEDFDGPPGFSGSHDRTWKLVESGAFDAGALNEAVWDRARREGQVDTEAVRAVHVTEPYDDYHWVVHPELDETYGEGTVDRIVEALLQLDERAGDDEQLAEVLDLFEAERFIPTEDANYSEIEAVARDLGLVEG